MAKTSLANFRSPSESAFTFAAVSLRPRCTQVGHQTNVVSILLDTKETGSITKCQRRSKKSRGWFCCLVIAFVWQRCPTLASSSIAKVLNLEVVPLWRVAKEQETQGVEEVLAAVRGNTARVHDNAVDADTQERQRDQASARNNGLDWDDFGLCTSFSSSSSSSQ